MVVVGSGEGLELEFGGCGCGSEGRVGDGVVGEFGDAKGRMWRDRLPGAEVMSAGVSVVSGGEVWMEGVGFQVCTNASAFTRG